MFGRALVALRSFAGQSISAAEGRYVDEPHGLPAVVAMTTLALHRLLSKFRNLVGYRYASFASRFIEADAQRLLLQSPLSWEPDRPAQDRA